jgi:hypothetical protein
MEHHVREFLVSQIKLGIIYNENFIIQPFKTLDLVRSHRIYEKSYDDCLINGIMTNDETLEWLKSEGLWTDTQEQDIKNSQDNIENIKLEMFKSSLNKNKVETLRKQLRGIEKALIKASSYKYSLLQNTCETNAEHDQKTWVILRSIKVKNRNFSVEDNISTIYSVYQQNLLSDKDIRELARSEPWHSLWTVSEKGKIPLFKSYKDREITYNQRNLLLWSQTYDNIQESIECPDRDIIEDDDLLDGWFILQARERKNEKKKKLLDQSTNNDKINNSSEVFIVSDSQEHANEIQNLNDSKSKMVLKQRMSKLDAIGSSDFYDFEDKKLEVINEAVKAKRGK